jgi:hypothetical protein
MDAPVVEIKVQCKALAEAMALEVAEREKLCLEKHTANELTQYHQRRLPSKLAANMPNCTLNFGTNTPR